MDETLVRQLTEWLRATDIDTLELRGPGVHVRLRNDGARADRMPTLPSQVAVRAPSVGHFLHAHPLHGRPLAAPGQAVAAGQAVGLLRIGALLLPVVAPRAGHFEGYVAGDGSTVGYGTPLAQLSVTHRAER